MREKVKNAVFANIMMKTIGDSRKYVRNLSQMMDNGFFMSYIKEQERVGNALVDDLNESMPKSRRDIDFFVSTHEEAAEALQLSLDKSLLKAKKQETRSRPSQIVSKSISLLKDVDTNIFEKLTDSEKENLRGQLSRLSTVVDRFDTMISDESAPAETPSTAEKEPIVTVKKVVSNVVEKPRFFIAKKHTDEPYIHCLSAGKPITNLGVTLEFEAYSFMPGQKDSATYRAFFINETNEIVSDVKEVSTTKGEKTRVMFTLSPKASSAKSCSLALQSTLDGVDELQQLIPFAINISFTSDFDF
jgi:hypothetical protein